MTIDEAIQRLNITIKQAKVHLEYLTNFCLTNKQCREENFCSDCYVDLEDILAIKVLLDYIGELK